MTGSKHPRNDHAIDRLLAAAENGDVQACYQLGECYAKGWSAECDEARAYD